MVYNVIIGTFLLPTAGQHIGMLLRIPDNGVMQCESRVHMCAASVHNLDGCAVLNSCSCNGFSLITVALQ